nr:hypothetical protein [Pandoravirus massiliensis]
MATLFCLLFSFSKREKRLLSFSPYRRHALGLRGLSLSLCVSPFTLWVYLAGGDARARASVLGVCVRVCVRACTGAPPFPRRCASFPFGTTRIERARMARPARTVSFRSLLHL